LRVNINSILDSQGSGIQGFVFTGGMVNKLFLLVCQLSLPVQH